MSHTDRGSLAKAGSDWKTFDEFSHQFEKEMELQEKQTPPAPPLPTPYQVDVQEIQNVIDVVKQAQERVQEPATSLALSDQEKEELKMVQVEEEAEKILREQKGIQGIFNFRDLSFHCSELKAQHLYRSASLSRGNPEESEVHEHLNMLKSHNIRTIIDLRCKKEKMLDPHEHVVEKEYPTIPDSEVLSHDASFWDVRKRFNISLYGTAMKIRGLFLPSPTSTKLKMLSRLFNPSECEILFSQEVVTKMGLSGLNKLCLIYSTSQIMKIMNVCLNPKSYPLLIHCTSGKDRTGLVISLILACCCVKKEDILLDFSDSEVRLQSLREFMIKEAHLKGLDTSFALSPKQIMVDTLEFIETNWGSVNQYLSSIGFMPESQSYLARILSTSAAAPDMAAYVASLPPTPSLSVSSPFVKNKPLKNSRSRDNSPSKQTVSQSSNAIPVPTQYLHPDAYHGATHDDQPLIFKSASEITGKSQMKSSRDVTPEKSLKASRDGSSKKAHEQEKNLKASRAGGSSAAMKESGGKNLKSSQEALENTKPEEAPKECSVS
eukprot:TRINITY_DN257_c0_g1_i2.p1 TRINITY_DN257_c0_g1~~TRINITY_DN257_c0_g1_i2.p1  ORF type:complete len:559 (-),score=116.26 TRINITY_DN257_c0_g1_i2:249-1892(-)